MNKKFRPKVLVLSPFLLYPAGHPSFIKTYHCLKIMASQFDVDLVVFFNSPVAYDVIERLKAEFSIKVWGVEKKMSLNHWPKRHPAEIIKQIFSVQPIIVKNFYSAVMQQLVEKLLSYTPYDWVYVDHVSLFQYIPIEERQKKKWRIILDQQSWEYVYLKRYREKIKNRLFKALIEFELQKWRRYEKQCCLLADSIFAASYPDKAFIENYGVEPLKIFVSPILFQNRLDRYYSQPGGERRAILFWGNLHWSEHRQAAVDFYENVFRLLKRRFPHLDFLVVSRKEDKNLFRGPLNKNSSHLFKPLLIDDLKNCLDSSVLSVVPSPIKGGMRLKLLDLLSYGMPVVAHPQGCAGIPLKDKQDVFLAHNPQEFLDQVSALIEDKSLRLQCSAHAQQFVEKMYSFNRFQSRYQEILQAAFS